MDTRIALGVSRADVVATNSASRVTPPGLVPFRDVVARGANALLQGAQAAISSLPGAPIVAAAVRPGGGPTASVASAGGVGAVGTAGLSPRFPGLPTAAGTAESPVGATPSSGPAESGSVEGALAQSQEFNLYYLQLQEQLAAENRSYSAMSNVLKARHDTVKNAIGNIR
jgi:hypothetical protein